MEAILQDWLSLALRWAHIVAGISWIGSSFYFMWLDSSLKRREGMPDGVRGENWTVHGGGFYHTQKYMVAPEAMPGDLHWFRWESYGTWLSGFCLLVVTYYWSASAYLIDRSVADIPPMRAITISVLGLGLGWVFYDRLCRSALRKYPVALFALLFVGLIVATWAYGQVFSARAAFIQVGATIATWMSGNVAGVIIPNQRIVVEDLKAGKVPDGKYGAIAKLRSTHNNYLTLPVIFFMLSNHYPLAFATEYNWAIAALVLLMGVTIRHYFNSMHARTGKPAWTWIATVALFIAIMYLSTFPPTTPKDAEGVSSIKLSPTELRLTKAASFEDVSDIVMGRCAMCHASEPGWEGIHRAPTGVILETPNHIARHARDIYLHSARSHAMPPANVSFMEAEERRKVAAWYETARR